MTLGLLFVLIIGPVIGHISFCHNLPFEKLLGVSALSLHSNEEPRVENVK